MLLNGWSGSNTGLVSEISDVQDYADAFASLNWYIVLVARLNVNDYMTTLLVLGTVRCIISIQEERY